MVRNWIQFKYKFNVFPLDTIVSLFVKLTYCVQISYWRDKRPKIVKTDLENKAGSPVLDIRYSHPWVSLGRGSRTHTPLLKSMMLESYMWDVHCCQYTHPPMCLELSRWLLVPNYLHRIDVGSHHKVEFGKSWQRCLYIVDTIYKLFLIWESGSLTILSQEWHLKWVDKEYKKLVGKSFHFPWIKSSSHQPIYHWIISVTRSAHQVPLEDVSNQVQQKLLPEPPLHLSNPSRHY